MNILPQSEIERIDENCKQHLHDINLAVNGEIRHSDSCEAHLITKGFISGAISEASLWFERMEKLAVWMADGNGYGFDYMGKGIWVHHDKRYQATTPEIITLFLDGLKTRRA